MTRQLRVHATELAFQYIAGGVDKVRETLKGKDNSGPTLLKAIEECRSKGKDVEALEALHTELYGPVTPREDMLSSVDPETQCTIATATENLFPRNWLMNAGLVGTLFRLFNVQPVGYYKVAGQKGKPAAVYRQKDVLHIIQVVSENKLP